MTILTASEAHIDKTSFKYLPHMKNIMIVVDEKDIVVKEDNAPYDVTMFWEFYRWEQYKIGYIYLQLFPNGKKYAGQTKNFEVRMSSYRKNKGSNPHHSNAIKKYTWNMVFIMKIACPWYLLDTIERFLIEYYNLTDTQNGYNKTTGGRKNWYHSKETRAIMSYAAHSSYRNNPQRRLQLSFLKKGNKNPQWGNFGIKNPNYGNHFKLKPEQIEKRSGAKNSMYGKIGKNNPNYGKSFKKTSEQIEKTSGEKNGMYGKIGKNSPIYGIKRTSEQIAKMSGSNHWSAKISSEEHPNYGRKLTSEQILNISGIKHGKSIPICVFGNVYPTTTSASNALRDQYCPNSRSNFIANWVRSKKYSSYTMEISKDFYMYVIENKIQNITRDMYNEWLAQLSSK
jgi:hypothetical protein